MNTHTAIMKIFNYIRSKDLLISSLGRTAEEVFIQANNHDQVLFVDCLGAVSGLGVGVALACKDTNVFAFDTDGSFIYNASILNTISKEKTNLGNLKLFIFDNEILESAGRLPSYSQNLDWLCFIKSWDVDCEVIKDETELDTVLNHIAGGCGLLITVVKVDNSNFENTCTKDIDGIESRYRFKRFINDNINGGIIRPCLKN